MRGGSARAVVGQLRTLYRCGVVGPLGDEQLLDRFLARRDEAAEEAFAELVRRHGPMVLGVCRRILRDAHEAEDAFQATFLVLARKAASVLRREKVASWLHGVAVRTAGQARARAARRRARERRVSRPIRVVAPDDGPSDELRDILDEELARLPARQRGPVVLCELEGLARPEAARRLGIPEGTLSSRLARAKARLRDRLARRGVALPTAALSAILIREARAVTVPLSLLESTVEAAALVAAGPTAAAALSAPVASLCQGVIKTMLVAKIKGIALAAGTMAAVVSGAVVLAQSGAGGGDALNRAEARKDGQRGPLPGAAGLADRSAGGDRAAALEQKLDRVLEALERLASPGDSRLTRPAGRLVNTMPEDRPLPAQAIPPHDTASVSPAPGGILPALPARTDDGSAVDPLEPRPLPDRMQAVEQQIQGILRRLERVEGQLKSLDARIGGGRGVRPTQEKRDLPTQEKR
jgi:RNA polymerase sigma-70 factor (ECF subfamily)